MFRLTVSGVAVYFVDMVKDSTELSESVSDAFREIIFIDVQPSDELVSVLKDLSRPRRKLVIRDRHWEQYWGDFESEISKYIDRYQSLIVQSDKSSCTGLIVCGEICEDDKVIVSNISLDGLLATLKAIGHFYPRIDLDSKILCGFTKGALSENVLSLKKTFDNTYGDDVEIQKLFEDFAAAFEMSNFPVFFRSCAVVPGAIKSE